MISTAAAATMGDAGPVETIEFNIRPNIVTAMNAIAARVRRICSFMDTFVLTSLPRNMMLGIYFISQIYLLVQYLGCLQENKVLSFIAFHCRN